MLIESRMMFASVDPVDEEVGEYDEKWKLQVIVPQARTVLRSVVHLAVSSNLGDEEWGSANSHHRQRSQCLFDLELNLVL